jgi:hypothetical protein
MSPGANPQQHNFSADQGAGVGAISIPQYEAGKFAYLADASNPGLMRCVLMQSHLLQPESIEKWLSLFESNENRYMKNLYIMLRDMRDYLEEKPGDICFKNFVQLVKNHGRKSTQMFFKNLYTNSSYGYGYTNPALPLGLANNHPMAERSTGGYEEDKLEKRLIKRKEHEKEGVREAFDHYEKAVIISLMQNRNKETNLATDPLVQISNLVAAGLLVPVQFIDSNGISATRYEPRNTAMAHTQPLNGTVYGGGLSVAETLKIIETIYGNTYEILLKCIEAREREDHLGILEYAKRLAYEISPPQSTNIGAQQLKPKEQRLEDDSHEVREEEGKQSRSEQEQEMKRRYETRDQEQGDRLFVSINDVETSQLPTFSAMYRGQSVDFQMPGPVREAFLRLTRKCGQLHQQQLHQQLQQQQLQQQQLQQQQETQPHRQGEEGPYHDLTAQQDIANHKRMIKDQQFVNETRRMLEQQIRERQKIESRRRQRATVTKILEVAT